MIYADDGQISQILINLIKNALQAGAGNIDITTYSIELVRTDPEQTVFELRFR